MTENLRLKNVQVEQYQPDGPKPPKSRALKYKINDEEPVRPELSAENIAIAKGHRIFTSIPKFENNGKRDLWAFNKWKEIGALNLKKLIKDGFLFIETMEVEDTKATQAARLTAIPGKDNESLITKKIKMTFPFRFDY